MTRSSSGLIKTVLAWLALLAGCGQHVAVDASRDAATDTDLADVELRQDTWADAGANTDVPASDGASTVDTRDSGAVDCSTQAEIPPLDTVLTNPPGLIRIMQFSDDARSWWGRQSRGVHVMFRFWRPDASLPIPVSPERVGDCVLTTYIADQEFLLAGSLTLSTREGLRTLPATIDDNLRFFDGGWMESSLWHAGDLIEASLTATSEVPALTFSTIFPQAPRILSPTWESGEIRLYVRRDGPIRITWSPFCGGLVRASIITGNATRAWPRRTASCFVRSDAGAIEFPASILARIIGPDLSLAAPPFLLVSGIVHERRTEGAIPTLIELEHRSLLALLDIE